MPPTLKVYRVPPCGIEERLAALVIAVAPMAPNLSLRSRPAVTGRPIQPPMPDHTDTYCLPFTEYVIGLPMIPEPNLRDHNTLPVDLSTARKLPPRLLQTANPPAVTRAPPQFGYWSGISHSVFPVTTLNFLNLPVTPGFSGYMYTLANT